MTPDDILAAVADEYRIEPGDILGRVRTDEVATARHVTMWLMREHLQMSSAGIGAVLDRDHSSVLHGIRRIETLMTRSEAMRIEKLSSHLRAGGRLSVQAPDDIDHLAAALTDAEIMLRRLARRIEEARHERA